MNARVYFTTDNSTVVEPIEELSRVAPIEEVRTETSVLPVGSTGTVVSVCGDGAAYRVEFTVPFIYWQLSKVTSWNLLLGKAVRISLPLPTVQIDTLKIIGYLLNINHKDGGAKAKYFGMRR